MAFTTEDYRKVWSAQTIRGLWNRSLMYRLFRNPFVAPWEQGAASAYVPVPAFDDDSANSEGIGVKNRARGGDWAAAYKGDAARVEITRSGGRAATNEIDAEDEIEMAWPVVATYRQAQETALRQQIDAAFYTALRALPSQTITGGTAGSTYVPNTYPFAATLASGDLHPIFQVIEQWALAAYRANLIDGDGVPSNPAVTPLMILPPELLVVLRRELKDAGLSFDPLTSQVLSNNVAQADGADIAGSLYGVNIFSFNTIDLPTGSNNWQGYAAVTDAVAVGVRPALSQFFSPQENQVSDNPAWLLRQAVDYAHAELVDGWHRKIEIHVN